MQFNMDGNHLLWDNVEAVLVRLKRHGGTAEIQIDIAKRGKLSRTDAEFVGFGTTQKNVVWNIPDVLLNPSANGRIIKKDDEVETEDGRGYTVISSDFEHKSSRWRLITAPNPG